MLLIMQHFKDLSYTVSVSNSTELFEIIRLLLQATAFVGLKHYVTVTEGGRGGFKISN